MDNLIEKRIEDVDDLKLALSELLGEKFPEIGKSSTYSWKIDLKGNKKFTLLDVKIKFEFSDKNIVTIRKIKPQSEEEKKGTILFSPIPGYLSVSAPLKIQKIITEPIPGGAKYTFFGINLPDTPEVRLEGELEVEFLKGAEEKEISVQMLIAPSFYRLKYWKWKKEHPDRQPYISYDLVTKHTKAIKPYDGKLGKPSSAKPDEERIQEYNWETKKGVLIKQPGIRNVALRTETFALILSYLQNSIDLDKYREVMHNAGFKIGETFMNDIMDKTGKMFQLTEWRDYDSAAGMGRYEFKKDEEGKLRQIVIENSFIAYDRSSNEPVCDFFCGYFEGGLKRIYGKSFFVKEEKCIAKNDLSCVFEVSDPATAHATSKGGEKNFSDADIDELTSIDGPVKHSGNYHGLSFFNVTNERNDKSVGVGVYSTADYNITPGDYIYVIGIKTGPNAMIAYQIEKQPPLQKELNSRS